MEILVAVAFIGVLGFLGFYIYDTRKYIGGIHKQLVDMPTELQKVHKELSHEKDKQTYKVMQESFKDFLKHIEKLERMTLPKPVTTADVQSVLNRMGEVTDAGAFENEIEKDPNKGVELPKDDWTGYINADTKVAFEEDEELPTVVEDSPVVVK